MLKSEVLHKHVNVSGIMLIDNSSLSTNAILCSAS